MRLRDVYNVLGVVAVVLINVCSGVEYCYAKTDSWKSDSDVHLSLFTSLRRADGNQCGEILSDALQNYVTVAWVVDKLNSGDGFIPGVKFGFELFDDCQNPLYAARNALTLLSPSLSSVVTQCNSSTTSTHLGVIGPSRSETAAEVARLLRDTHFPLISPSATVADLSNKTLYPNFLRTALPDTVQITPVLDILVELDWTYVVIVHSDDIYGRTASAMLQTQSRSRGICFIKSIEMSRDSRDRSEVFEDLAAVQDRSQGNVLGVVYFGMWDIAKQLMDYVKRNQVTDLHWLMSDSVGRVHDVFVDKEDAAVGTLTLSPRTTEFKELKDFWTNRLNNDPTVQKYLNQQDSNKNLMNITQSDYVAAVVDAVYAYAVTLKQEHERLCKGNDGLCDDLKVYINSDNNFLKSIKGITVDYSTLNSTFAPEEFIETGSEFSFRETGDIARSSESVLYEVNSFDTTYQFVNVGAYRSTGLTLNKTLIKMKSGNSFVSGDSLPKSLCEGYCKACVEFGHVPMVFLEGDVYIVGVFSLHDASDDHPFECGAFRNVASDTVALEAFLFSIQELRRETGIKFGAVAFDDCYSPTRLTTIVSEYFSTIGNPSGVYSNLVLFNKTAAVVGSLSSGSTIPLTRFFNGLNIPVISYASSTPDLDDRVNFPYFLRTVPSDVEQAEAMVKIIKTMGWEYVSLVYVNNNYGTKGMQAFRTLAAEEGICVMQPKAISETAGDNFDVDVYSVVQELVQEEAKIVVFFGIDTRFEKFVETVEANEQYGKFIIIASEDWGNKPNIIAAGDKASRGALTLKLELIRTNPFPGFEKNLLAKTPQNYEANPWFEEFWQNEFDCNIRGGFNNRFAKECTNNEELTADDMRNHFDDQRVSHVQYATYAAGMGIKAAKEILCADSGEFPCRFYYESRYSKDVWNAIRTVKNPNLESFMFDDNGNGAIGFTIYNVQKNGDGTSYVEVGTFSKNGLSFDRDKVKFYSEIGGDMDIVAKCDEGSRCSMCTFPSTSKPGSLAGYNSNPDGSFRVVDIVIIIILAVFVILLIIVAVMGFKYLRNKMKGLSKKIEEQGLKAREPTDHVYQAVSDIAVYQNKQVSPDRRPVRPPQHIYFVNGSNDNLHDVGHDNQGFRAEDTLSQRNVSGGTVASTGVTNTASSPSQTSADRSSLPPRNSSVSPTGSGHLTMTEIPNSPMSNRVPNGQIPNGSVGSPQNPRPSTLHLHQNPRFVDMRQGSLDGGNMAMMVSPTHMSSRPDLQHMPESYVGSPMSSMSPVSQVGHVPASQPQVMLSHQTSPLVLADPSLMQSNPSLMQSNPSLMQSLANQQAVIDHQTALELQRLQVLQQQQNALNQHMTNPYIPLASTESFPRYPQYPSNIPASPPNQPRPRTNPQHAPNNLSRILAHHGSVDSLRSSGRSLGTLPNIQMGTSRENVSENIQLQSLGPPDSRISRV